MRVLPHTRQHFSSLTSCRATSKAHVCLLAAPAADKVIKFCDTFGSLEVQTIFFYPHFFRLIEFWVPLVLLHLPGSLITGEGATQPVGLCVNPATIVTFNSVTSLTGRESTDLPTEEEEGRLENKAREPEVRVFFPAGFRRFFLDTVGERVKQHGDNSGAKR